MKICYFGGYQRDHARNAVILRGLEINDVVVKECHSRHSLKFLRYPLLIIKFFRNCLKTDIILVASSCHYYVFLAWILAKLSRKLLVFDPLVSLFDTFVHDRNLANVGSVRAKWYWAIDKITCTLPERVILDTELHVEYFSRTFGLPTEKFCVVPVGADDAIFFPRPQTAVRQSKACEVVYAGNFIPLHGVTKIIEAANLLRNENFHFTLIGDGQTFSDARNLVNYWNLDKVDFIGRLPREEYASYISKADIVLGIFGASEKAQRVVPCKVYDAIAMGKAVVTSNTLAIGKAFSNEENIMLCNADDGASLASKLIQLASNPELRSHIEEQAKKLFEQNYSTRIIGQTLLSCLVNYKRPK